MKIIYLTLILFFSTIKLCFSAQSQNDSLAQQVQNASHDSDRVNILIAFSKKLYLTGEYDQLLPYLAQAKTLSEKLIQSRVPEEVKSGKRGLASYYNAIGNVYHFRGNYDEALTCFSKSLSLNKELKDNKAMALSKNNIANVYSQIGNYPDALKQYFESLKLKEEINDMRGISNSYVNIGVVYVNLKNYSEAINNFNAAIKIKNQIDDKSGIAAALNNIGNIYKRQKKYTDALKYFNQALLIVKELGDKYSIALAYENIASVYMEQRKFNEALENCARASALFEELSVKSEMVTVYNIIGNIFTQQKQFNKAGGFLNKALKIADDIGSKEGKKDSYKSLSKLVASQQDYKQALAWFEQYSDIKDSLLDEESSEQISKLKTVYETEKKDKEIALLNKDKEISAVKAMREKTMRIFLIAGAVILILFLIITYYRYKQRKLLSEKLSLSLTELKQTQQQLIETERQREQENIRLRISRDIHDEIGGNLTKIALLSDVISSETKSNGETKHSLEKISEYARNVNTSLSEIVWSVNPKQDTLESLVAYMRNYVHSFLQDTGINFKLDFPDEVTHRQINPEFKRTIFLVLKETLNNCVKHSKAKNIEIKFHITKNHFEFVIKDDGAGFDMTNKSVFGNGLINMEYRVKQFDGDFKISSLPQKGCEIDVTGDLV